MFFLLSTFILTTRETNILLVFQQHWAVEFSNGHDLRCVVYVIPSLQEVMACACFLWKVVILRNYELHMLMQLHTFMFLDSSLVRMKEKFPHSPLNGSSTKNQNPNPSIFSVVLMWLYLQSACVELEQACLDGSTVICMVISEIQC